MSIELIETSGVVSDTRFFGKVGRSREPCTFTVFDNRVTVENHHNNKGIVLSLGGKELVGIWGYHLKGEEKGVLIKTKCGGEHRVEPSQEVSEIFIDGKKVYP